MGIGTDMVHHDLSATTILNDVEIHVPPEGLIDVEVERTRLTRELKRMQEDTARLEAKLARHDFLEKAPEDIIEKEQLRHQGLRERAGKLADALEAIQ